jgi:hypothetical protein
MPSSRPIKSPTEAVPKSASGSWEFTSTYSCLIHRTGHAADRAIYPTERPRGAKTQRVAPYHVISLAIWGSRPPEDSARARAAGPAAAFLHRIGICRVQRASVAPAILPTALHSLRNGGVVGLGLWWRDSEIGKTQRSPLIQAVAQADAIVG